MPILWKAMLRNVHFRQELQLVDDPIGHRRRQLRIRFNPTVQTKIDAKTIVRSQKMNVRRFRINRIIKDPANEPVYMTRLCAQQLFHRMPTPRNMLHSICDHPAQQCRMNAHGITQKKRCISIHRLKGVTLCCIRRTQTNIAPIALQLIHCPVCTLNKRRLQTRISFQIYIRKAKKSGQQWLGIVGFHLLALQPFAQHIVIRPRRITIRQAGICKQLHQITTEQSHHEALLQYEYFSFSIFHCGYYTNYDISIWFRIQYMF